MSLYKLKLLRLSILFYRILLFRKEVIQMNPILGRILVEVGIVVLKEISRMITSR